MNSFINVKRLIFFVLFLAICIMVLVMQYAKFMLFREHPVREPRINQERGSIVDRNGKYLAAQTTLYNLSGNKNLITNPDEAASVLSPLIHLSKKTIKDRISTGASSFFYLKKKMSASEKDAVAEALKKEAIRGFNIEAVQNRTYPENNLASTVIGYLGDDGKGLTGVEYSMQNLLSPSPTDPHYLGAGYTIMLSIDSTIQYMMEKIASKVMEETHASGISFLAVDAKTGEILAYVNKPQPNLSNFAASTASERFDRPAYFIYEPGSVFKIFSMASFLELGSTYDGAVYQCDGVFSFLPHALKDAQKGNTITCLRVHGTVTPRDIIRLSCNDGTAQIADKTDSNAFYQKLRAFGFGSRTGIQLPGETVGLFASPEKWSHRTKHTIAMGQEIGVSALQMVAAATALTNKGVPLKLSLLHKIYTADGRCIFTHQREEKPAVISAQTASKVLSYMQSAAERGTGHKALIRGVPIAVKTGTAQMARTDAKGYSDTDYVASCIGIFPADDPEIILYMAVIQPQGPKTYGELIAAPTISAAANEIIDYRGLHRDNAPSVIHNGVINTKPLAPAHIDGTMPNLIGMPKRLLLDLLNRKDITVQLHGDGYVYKQEPKAGASISEGDTIELYLRAF